MTTSVKEKKVSDMTVGELQEIIRETMQEMIDPDYGLELRPEVVEELKASTQSKERFPVGQVVEELGLKW